MILQRLAALREEMKRTGTDAFIIPSTDPHQSEYVADHWQARRWISGFTGSAGSVVVFADEAGLWTDSRYFLQAEQELKDTGITLFRMKNQFEAEYAQYILTKLKPGQTVAIDGLMWSHAMVNDLKTMFSQEEIKLETNSNIIDSVWQDRPSLLMDVILVHDSKYAGKSAKEKISEVRQAMAQQKVDYHFITALDDIAWLYNVRGKDVAYNPVVVSYALVGRNEAYFFVDEKKTDDQIKAYFADQEINIIPYSETTSFLSKLPAEAKMSVDAAICSDKIYHIISCQKQVGTSIPKLLKAIKNDVECEHIRHAMAKDGAALANTFFWLENKLGNEPITEYNVLEKLAYFRSQQKAYFGESFGAIVGYKGNGAIIHYAPPAHGSALIQPEGILLVDSGGQYKDGTTDITRTFSLSNPTDEEKKHYTLILKGLIALSKIKFPKGTSGGQLDTLARQFLWENGLNYLHGTGHGVGFFLNVHEPPQGFASIASERGRTIIEPGMLTSNEPGHYIAGKYGMRLENLIICQESETDGFLSFETVTLYPFEIQLIHQNMLTPAEIQWFNQYHELVWEKVSPLLSGEIKDWFATKCQTLDWKHS